jgi:hypothetical protein
MSYHIRDGEAGSLKYGLKYVQAAAIPQLPHIASTLDEVKMWAPAVVPESPSAMNCHCTYVRIMNMESTALV